jgi:hypothetical protein
MGKLSAKAQNLLQIITSMLKFVSSDHRIVIKIKCNQVMGFLKIGEKYLFYRDFVSFFVYL